MDKQTRTGDEYIIMEKHGGRGAGSTAPLQINTGPVAASAEP